MFGLHRIKTNFRLLSYLIIIVISTIFSLPRNLNSSYEYIKSNVTYVDDDLYFYGKKLISRKDVEVTCVDRKYSKDFDYLDLNNAFYNKVTNDPSIPVIKTLKTKNWDYLGDYFKQRMIPLIAYLVIAVFLFIPWIISCCCFCDPKWFCRNPTEYEVLMESEELKDFNGRQDIEYNEEDLVNKSKKDPHFYEKELERRDNYCSCRKCSYLITWIISTICVFPALMGIISLQ